MTLLAPYAVPAGWGLDRLLGEPPTAIHPVAQFGSAMTRLERKIHSDSRRRGIVYTAAGVGLGAAAGFATRAGAGRVVSVAVVSWLAMAGKMLESEGRGVAAALDAGDVIEARRRVGMLVGRQTDELEEVEVVRAVIETLAENTTDAATATMFWAAVGGAPGAAMHRCINTMDAMVGHRNQRHERFGWASAKLDDLVNWIPARLTALAVIVVRPHRAVEVVRTIRRDARQHPSPNGGMVEAAFAGALGVQLGGSNSYGGVIEHRGLLGDGDRPASADIERTVILSRHVGMVHAAVAFAVGRRLRRQPR